MAKFIIPNNVPNRHEAHKLLSLFEAVERRGRCHFNHRLYDEYLYRALYFDGYPMYVTVNDGIMTVKQEKYDVLVHLNMSTRYITVEVQAQVFGEQNQKIVWKHTVSESEFNPDTILDEYEKGWHSYVSLLLPFFRNFHRAANSDMHFDMTVDISDLEAVYIDIRTSFGSQNCMNSADYCKSVMKCTLPFQALTAREGWNLYLQAQEKCNELGIATYYNRHPEYYSWLRPFNPLLDT